MRAGMMPILTFAEGRMIPGQFGPMSRLERFARYSFALIMSLTGTPSVIATMRGTPASDASMIASAAAGGGTNTIEAFAPVAFTAAWREPLTGRAYPDVRRVAGG